MLTATELRKAMIASAGEDESITLGEGFETTDFVELGFDSLALMETCSQLKRTHGVVIPDETLWDFVTPEELLRWVNDNISR
ncbi:acyl carrier protein [Rhodococcus sp. IEGM 1318]|uniref:acyl carrier protein n=1 Tax=Rhodococcus sp. IEGM 1318 TaxID=3082226 RepID=UPI0029551252|nr:acyl carrier protein [Rhodococcus sp. IEGM 1318]MDV8009331.1 acyl carrier protein [Rhodococcus sp. IEGM 1318]